MKRVAVLTCSAFPELSPDCQVGAQALTGHGIQVVPVIWDSTPVRELHGYDAVLMRSVWDYQRKLGKFFNWLAELRQDPPRLFLNSPEVIHWNHTKRYLAELEAGGLPVVPTKWIPSSGSFPSELPWKKIIIKPVISASADLTFCLNRDDAPAVSQAFQAVRAQSDVMIQPFCESILAEGEVSLVYFHDGARASLSHTVWKRPKPGDFRVQHEHGGLYERVEPSPEHLALGERTVASLPSGWLYARVDVLKYENALCLGEVEMIEPQLYFRWAQDGAERFADAVRGWLSR